MEMGMQTGLLIYFSSLAVLATFFLGGAMMTYLGDKEAKTWGFRLLAFNILFVASVLCIGASGAYMAFDKTGTFNTKPAAIEQPAK